MSELELLLLAVDQDLEDAFYCGDEPQQELLDRFSVLREELRIREALRAEEERREVLLDLLDVVEDAFSWSYYHAQL